MGGLSSKRKGAAAEREAARTLWAILEPVYSGLGREVPDIQRNLMQTREGGYDLVGLDWIALEVKRQERANVEAWWRQAVQQTGPGQIPVLMWRQNHQPWRYRVQVHVATGRSWMWTHVDMEGDVFYGWLQKSVRERLISRSG